MSNVAPIIRIFISSPGDVVDERDQARRVVTELERIYAGATLAVVLWEDLALPATASFQQTIDGLLKQKPIDIAVFILWSRLGTPLGPDTTRPDGTPYRSGTEREFDLMLAAFEQSSHKRPVILAYYRDDQDGFLRQLVASPDRINELVAQRKLTESFVREQFYDADGHNVRALHSYSEPVSFAQRLRTHLRRALDELLGNDAARRWTGEPYRGLAAFDVAHAPIFHGRDEETCDVLARLREQQAAGCAFVVIVGASGSGKSSLARAGVAATLAAHAFDDARAWRIATLIPGLGDGTPCTRLARVLAETVPELAAAKTPLDEFAASLADKPETPIKLSLIPALARAADEAGGPVRLLLLVDQMEELWTDRRITADDRSRFIAAVEVLARSGPISVLATLRSDFYPHAQSEPGFLRMKGERGHYDLLPPGTTALGRLITEPARLAGLRFERNEQTGRTLDAVILEDAAGDPSALPLVEYALGELYRRSDPANRLLTFAAYEVLGGVEGALGTRAAEVFGQLPAEARAALPELLPQLVTIDVAGDEAAVRRRAPLVELTSTPARKLLIESLIAARFLTTDRLEEVPVAGLAHEALLRRWTRLVEWVRENREQLRRRTRVEQAQSRWERNHQDVSLLLPPGLPLEEARQLLREGEGLLRNETKDFIRASITYDESQQARNRRRRRTVMAALGLLTAAAVVGGIFAFSGRRAALDAEGKAIVARNEAVASQIAELEAKNAAEATNARNALFRGYQEARGSDKRLGAWHLWQISKSANSPPEVRQGALDLMPFALQTMGRRIPGAGHVHLAADNNQIVLLDEKRACFFDVATGEPLKHQATPAELRGFDAYHHVSPDGQRDVVYKSKQLAIWDLAEGAAHVSPELEGDDEYETDRIAFSRDSRLVATIKESGTIDVWETKNLKHRQSIPHHVESLAKIYLGDISALEFLDSQTLLSAADDGQILLTDVASGAVLASEKWNENDIELIRFAPEPKILFVQSGSSSAVYRYDSQTRSVERKQTLAPTWDAHFSPDGSLCALSYADGRTAVSIFNTQTWTTVAGPLALPDECMVRLFTPDNRFFVTISDRGGAVTFWDTASGRITGELRGDDGATDLTVTRDSSYLILSDGSAVRIVATAALFRPCLVHPAANSIRSIAFGPASRELVYSSFKDTQLLDTQWLTAKAMPPSGRPVEALAREAERSRAGDPIVWADVDAERRVTTEFGEEATLVAMSPTERLALVKRGDEHFLWDTAGKELRKLPWQRGMEYGVFSRDDSLLAVVSHDNGVHVFETGSGKPCGPGCPLPAAGGTPRMSAAACAVVSKNPPIVAIGTRTGWVHFVDGHAGKLDGESLGVKAPVDCLAVSSDGRTLAVGLENGLLTFWDVFTRREVEDRIQFPVANSNADVTAVALSADRRWAAFSDGSGEDSLLGIVRRPMPLPPAGELLDLYLQIRTGYADRGDELPTELTDEEWRDAWKRWKGPAAEYLEQLHRDARETRRFESMVAAQDAERDKKWSMALVHLDRLLEDEPEVVRFRLQRARARHATAKWELCLQDFAAAVRLDPKACDARHLRMRADAHASKGDWAEAGRDLEAAIVLDSTHAFTHYRLGLLKLHTGDDEGALESLPDILGPDPGLFSDAYRLTCELASLMALDPKTFESLEQQLSGALKRRSEKRFHYQLHAVMLYRCGRHADALEAFGLLAKLYPGETYADDLLWKAMTYEKTGEHEKGVESYWKAAETLDDPAKSLRWEDAIYYGRLRREAEGVLKIEQEKKGRSD